MKSYYYSIKHSFLNSNSINRVPVSAVDEIKNLLEENGQYLEHREDELFTKEFNGMYKAIMAINNIGGKYSVKRFNLDGKVSHLGFFSANEVRFIKNWVMKTKQLKWIYWQKMLKELRTFEVDETGNIKTKKIVKVRSDAATIYKDTTPAGEYKTEDQNKWFKLEQKEFEVKKFTFKWAVIFLPFELSKWGEFLIEAKYIDRIDTIKILKCKKVVA